MRISCFVGLMAFTTLGLVGCSQKSDSQQLAGEWAVVAIEAEGIAASPEELKAMRWAIAGNVITGTQGGDTGRMSFRLNSGKTPKEIDITALDGNRQGETDPGIYSLDKGRLRICLGENGDRPQEFGISGKSWVMVLEKITR